MMALPLIETGKLWPGRVWCAWEISGALFGQATLEKPTGHLSGDTPKTVGYSRVEFRAAGKAGDINWEVISSSWMG